MKAAGKASRRFAHHPSERARQRQTSNRATRPRSADPGLAAHVGGAAGGGQRLHQLVAAEPDSPLRRRDKARFRSPRTRRSPWRPVPPPPGPPPAASSRREACTSAVPLAGAAASCRGGGRGRRRGQDSRRGGADHRRYGGRRRRRARRPRRAVEVRPPRVVAVLPRPVQYVHSTAAARMFCAGSVSVVRSTSAQLRGQPRQVDVVDLQQPAVVRRRAVGSQFDSRAMIADIWVTSHPPGGA